MAETDLLETIELHLVEHRITPARFGRAVVRDPRFVFDLRAGRKPRKKMLTKVSAYLASLRHLFVNGVAQDEQQDRDDNGKPE